MSDGFAASPALSVILKKYSPVGKPSGVHTKEVPVAVVVMGPCRTSLALPAGPVCKVIVQLDEQPSNLSVNGFPSVIASSAWVLRNAGCAAAAAERAEIARAYFILSDGNENIVENGKWK